MPSALTIVLLVFAAVALVIGVLVIKARLEGERLYAQYASYSQRVLSNSFQFTPGDLKEKFRDLRPAKALGLFHVVASSQKGDRIARANSLNATIGGFMKMFTLVLRPDPRFNLPIFSVDFIFIGAKRVFVIEIIDPAGIEDENKTKHYEKMRTWMDHVTKFEPSGTGSDWSEKYLTDFSIHIKADRGSDPMLFDIYKSYLSSYIDMAKNAVELDDEARTRVQAGMTDYVNTLLAKGGPAVDVFEKLLGKAGQGEYVRGVVFGLE